MMQRLADDPVFWAALTAILGLIGVWAKAKTAEYEARNANGKADSVAAGQGVQQATLVQHTAQIAALEAVTPAASGVPAAQVSVPSAAAIAPAPAAAAPAPLPAAPGLSVPGPEQAAPPGPPLA